MWAPRSRHQAIPGGSALCQCTVVSATEGQPGCDGSQVTSLVARGLKRGRWVEGSVGLTEAAGPSSWRWAAASPAVAAPGSRACAGWQSPMTHVAHFFMTIRLNLA